MMRTVGLVLFLVMMFSVSLCFAQPPQNRVAVVNLKVTSDDWGWDFEDIDVWMLDLVASKLEKAGWTVLERKKIQAILREQKFSRSLWVDPQTAIAAGGLLGAEKLLEATARVETNWLEGGVGDLEFEVVKATVRLNGRIVDTRTGELSPVAIVSSGKASPGGLGIFLGGLDGFFRASDPEDRAVNEAANGAVSRLVKQLTANLPVEISTSLPELQPPTPQFLFLTSDAEVEKGEHFGIWRGDRLIAEVEAIGPAAGGRIKCRILRTAVPDPGTAGDIAKPLIPIIPVVDE